jgi:hypothetical protein
MKMKIFKNLKFIEISNILFTFWSARRNARCEIGQNWILASQWMRRERRRRKSRRGGKGAAAA